MGRIIVNIPTNEFIEVRIISRRKAAEVIEFLQKIVEPNLSPEDRHDLDCIDKAKRAISKYGTIPWEQVKENLKL